MTQDVYSEAINAVCDFHNIEWDVCVNYFWEEVEEYMQLRLMFIQADMNRRNSSED